MEDDPGMEMEAIEAERLDADLEMAELEAAGRKADRRYRKMNALRVAGKLKDAARVCPHGWVGPVDDETEYLYCYHCGSRVSEDIPPDVLEPCVIEPRV